ncbi:MAG: response regulator transcription factor [Cyclobacteriaceae bacterium]
MRYPPFQEFYGELVAIATPAPMKILIVEDELIVADNLSNTLKRLGYTPLEPAISYTQALERLAEKPDLALLDVHLSGQKDGIDVAEYLNEHLHIPIVFLTAYGDDATIERAKKVLPAGYLLKPFKRADIKPTIEIAITNFQARSRREITKSNLLTRLNASEVQIVKLIAENKTTAQIAEVMFLSTSTIKNKRHKICAKLELPPSNNALLSWCANHRQEIARH